MLSRFITFNRTLSKSFSKNHSAFFKSDNYKDKMLEIIRSFIDTHASARILEAGGVDRPLLEKSSKIRYEGLDIEFRPACSKIYDAFFVQSIEEPLAGPYDLVCSYTLLEHVKNNDRAVQNMFSALKPGGLIVHYLPSKYHPYALVARVLGPALSARLLRTTHPENNGIAGYPSYFHKCTPSELTGLCRGIGFQKVEVIAFYRANAYFEVFFPLYLLVTLWENICRRFRWTLLCSGFILIAAKQSPAPAGPLSAFNTDNTKSGNN